MRSLTRRAAVLLALALSACSGGAGGVIPSNRYVDRDIDAVRRSDAQDVRDLRPVQPGFEPPSRGAEGTAPLTR